MKRRRSYQSRGALEWIEEATHLLRTCPPAVLATYYIGALPFVLGLLFFWADMSRSPFAKQHVVEASLGVAFLFIWMKTWQAVFCLRLRSIVSGETAEPMTLRRCLRMFIAQATIQPPGLLLIPLALVITLPFAWVFGFYQNATAVAKPGAVEGQSLFRRAVRSTHFWPGQYHVILLVLGAFAGFVFLNWAIVCTMLPGLLKMLLGIETTFSRSLSAMLNTTFFATMAGLTYLSVDPVVKALHVLRCFRGEAQTTGDDLKSELRHVVIAGRQVAAIAVLAAICFTGSLAHATETTPSPPPTATPVAQRAPLPSQQLNKTIEDVINQQKYTWRMPREKMMKQEKDEQGPIAKFFSKIAERLRKMARAVSDWIGDMLNKIFNRQPRESSPRGSPGNWGAGLAAGARLLLYALIAALILALLWLVYRFWRNRREGPEIVEATPIQPVPDLTDENVGADQLPDDEWMRLARELLARGEFRLALRAYYLSSLASLAERRLITLAKFKSNRDYERELARRGHMLADLFAVFAENVVAFDRAWYGLHAVDAEAVGRFASNVEKIRTAA